MGRWEEEKRKDYMRQYMLDKRRKQQIVVRNAKAKPCADCNVEYSYYTMTFDHLDDKAGTLSKMAANPRTSMKRLLDEIAKCDVVCFNCHSERTHQRALAAGQRIEELEEPSPRLLPPGERTHCPQGHEYTEDNTYHNRGGRFCRTCARAARAEWEKRHRRVNGKWIPKATAA